MKLRAFIHPIRQRLLLAVLAGPTLLAVAAAGSAGAPAVGAGSPSPEWVGTDISPGRVELVVSPLGGWERFGPVGRAPVLTHGGILVFARGTDAVRPVLDTRNVSGNELAAQFSARAHEGSAHGARYPSPGSDDDRDGRVDEDRLDGLDNDGDGRVDEDFAAAGDEMSVCRREFALDGDAALSVYEEHCAWSLPHIDGMVVTRYIVRNRGVAPLENVRVGVAFSIPFGMDLSTRAIDPAEAIDTPNKMTAHVMELEGETPMATVLAVPRRERVGYRAHGAESGGWVVGLSPPDADATMIAHRVESTASPGAESREGSADKHAVSSEGDRRRTRDGKPQDEGPGGRAEPRETAWALSPDLGTLDPGEEVSIFVGLLVPPKGRRGARAVEDVTRTIVGDGVHRMIPPPAWSTRRVVWGTWSNHMPDNPDAGASITLFRPLDAGVEPSRVVFLQRVDLRNTAIATDAGGNARLEVDGNFAGGVSGKEKVVLRGRLQDGQWFDAVLEPADETRDGGDAMAWFSQEGPLNEALLIGSPNPFRVGTTISWEVPARVTDERGVSLSFGRPIETSVKVYDVTGRLVSTLHEGPQSPGSYQEQWAARNEAGTFVASGVYYVKLQIGRRFITQRLTQLK